jgi:predicted Zn-dependent protease
MKTFMRFIAVMLCAGGCLISSGCVTVPETGRTQLNLLSPAEESQLGFAAFEEMKGEIPVSEDPEANRLVQEVGRRIAAVADLPGAEWEFVVFDSPEVNAFCLPGGKVGVYTGILQITQNEGGMATVLGHEVAHAVARHGGERVSQAMLMQTGGQALGAALGGTEESTQAAAATVYGLGAQLGVALPHSRRQEAEADEIGLLYMARAGYNPEEAVSFWERFGEFNQEQGGGAPWFLRTHPLDSDRIENLKRLLPAAAAEYRQARQRPQP